MTENQQIEEPVVAQEPALGEQPQVEEVQSEPTAEATADYAYNAPEENIRNLRESRKQEQERAMRAEYERDQLLELINKSQGSKPQQESHIEDELGFSEDDIVDGKQLGKVANNVKELKQEIESWKTSNEEVTAELKLNNEFSDFNNVVTADNVDKLIEKYPEMKSSIVNNNPLYDRGKASYRLIKKFLQQDTVNYEQKHNKVKANTSKPMPTSSINNQQGDSPLTQANLWANGYNQNVADHLRKEMDEAIAKH